MKRISFISTLVIIFLIFLLANMIVGSTLTHWRIDMTEENIYTLSQGTKNILNDLTEGVTLKYYVSKTETVTLPFIKNYAERVKGFLEEYKRAGKGRIILEMYDPRPDTEEQEWAEKFGMQRVPLQNGVSIYFGLAGVNERGDEDVIPFFNPNREEFLEYDITRLIHKLSNPEKKTIGLISSLPVLGAKPDPYTAPGPGNRSIDPWLITQELQQLYTIEDLTGSVEAIPDKVDVLLLIHPKELPETTLFAIDQFILRGGRALIFVDPFCEADTPSHDPQRPYETLFAKRASNLKKLFTAWGIELTEGKVAADRNLAAQVNVDRNRTMSYVVWLMLSDKQIKSDDVVTGKLENLLMAYPGFFKTKDVDRLNVTPLLLTTKDASGVNASYMELRNPETLLDRFVAGEEAVPLAVRVSGIFRSAFPEGKPGSKKEEEEKQDEVLSQSAEESNVIIVADVDMISDRFSVRIQNFLGQKIAFPLNDNLNFFYNAIENLTGSHDLISVRSRGTFQRPFTRVKEIEKAAEDRWKDEEKGLEQKVSEINTRLQELLRPGGDAKKQVLSRAIEDEINRYRGEKKKTQKKLREVRRKLREDKESLGNRLFVMNTFLIPFLICCSGIAVFIARRR